MLNCATRYLYKHKTCEKPAARVEQATVNGICEWYGSVYSLCNTLHLFSNLVQDMPLQSYMHQAYDIQVFSSIFSRLNTALTILPNLPSRNAVSNPTTTLSNIIFARGGITIFAVLQQTFSISWLVHCTAWLWNVLYTVKPVYNDHLMGYCSAFWSSSRWPRAT